MHTGQNTDIHGSFCVHLPARRRLGEGGCSVLCSSVVPSGGRTGMSDQYPHVRAEVRNRKNSERSNPASRNSRKDSGTREKRGELVLLNL